MQNNPKKGKKHEKIMDHIGVLRFWRDGCGGTDDGAERNAGGIRDAGRSADHGDNGVFSRV